MQPGVVAMTFAHGDAELILHEDRNRGDMEVVFAVDDVRAFLDGLLTPLVRWDALWYLAIAQDGYSGDDALSAEKRAAFFPLYPLLVRGVGTLFGGSHAALLLAAYLVSLAAFLVAIAGMWAIARDMPVRSHTA